MTSVDTFRLEAKELVSESLRIELIAIFNAICVQYGRMYSDSSYRKTRLNKDNIKEDALKLVHQKIIEIRNCYIAHSADEISEASNIVIVSDPDNDKIFEIRYETCKATYVDRESIQDVKRLVSLLKEYVERKCKKLHSIIDSMIVSGALKPQSQ